MRKKIIILLIIGLLVVGGYFVSIFPYSFAIPLENGIEVEKGSDLTYYIDVLYDGKDSQAISSSNEAIADVRSDYIYVEDKIPNGLTFKEFVSSGDDTIGAVTRKDESVSCSGYVVDGYNGLKYNSDTNTITFKVKGLQAGCKLTVGVVATTPASLPEDTNRMDFYNTAFIKENNFSAQSNTVHVFMGRQDVDVYNVIYEFEGDIPNNIELPSTNSYTSGSLVSVIGEPKIDGYTFSGWTSTDVSVSNGNFTMPSKNVTFKGSFTKNTSHSVSYQIDGEMPEIYKVPNTKDYVEGSDVFLDSLQKDDIIDGYRFLGWETDDVELIVTREDTSFVMPNSDVVITGKFEKVKYTITYKFQGSILPPNSDSLLPVSESHYPGEEVVLAAEPTASSYKFLGWYNDNNFKMPEENITIYGEWGLQSGLFEPTITQEIVNPKEKYKKGDVVRFKIAVTNTSAFPIKEVILKNQYTFVEDTGYTLMNEHYAKIPEITGLSTMVIYSQYQVETNEYKNLDNNAEIVGAVADNNYSLDNSKQYQARVKFSVGEVTLKINTIDNNNNSLTGSEFVLYEDKENTKEFGKGIIFEDMDLDKTYYLKETKSPEGYVLNDHVFEVVVSKDGKLTVDQKEVKIDAGNYLLDIVNEKQNIINSPNTLDSIITYIILLLVSLGIIGYTVYKLNKNKRVSIK